MTWENANDLRKRGSLDESAWLQDYYVEAKNGKLTETYLDSKLEWDISTSSAGSDGIFTLRNRTLNFTTAAGNKSIRGNWNTQGGKMAARRVFRIRILAHQDHLREREMENKRRRGEITDLRSGRGTRGKLEASGF